MDMTDGNRTRVVVLARSARSLGMGAANARPRVLVAPREWSPFGFQVFSLRILCFT